MPELNLDLYDDTTGYDEEKSVYLNPAVSENEMGRAILLYTLFRKMVGVCIIVGKPGTGKDLFSNIVSYTLKRAFPWKRVLRDEKPRTAYGEYAELFNDKILDADIARMKMVATGTPSKAKDIKFNLEKLTERWVTERGEVMLKDSILCLTEYWRYCYKRDAMSTMNKTMGAIHKVKRHLDVLILGTVQQISDLDTQTCLPFVDWRVTCSPSVVNPTGFSYFVEHIVYDRRAMALIPLGSPTPIAFDAGKPREEIGDGKIKLINPEYEPSTPLDRKIKMAILSGANTLKALEKEITSDEEGKKELLLRLKELRFSRSNRVLDYPCFFSLYNSKSAPQLTPSSVSKIED